MSTTAQAGRTVLHVPGMLLPLLRPFFVYSMPERGGILRVGGKRWGPIVRGPFGVF